MKIKVNKFDFATGKVASSEREIPDHPPSTPLLDALRPHPAPPQDNEKMSKQAAINKIIDEDPVNNWWLEEDAFEGWK